MNDCIPTVLYVEDNPNDRLLVTVAFRNADILVHLHVVENGEQAIDYLAGNGVYARREDHPFPKLVLLDLKLPRQSGLEVLKWIRNQDSLKGLQVVVLSSSARTDDMDQALRLGASAYYAKPVSLEPLREMIMEISSKWLA
ncbi:MAG: response regulator [Pedosphaera sp.]|nr:response regulator [Pedosphaera sp.]